MKSPLLPFEPGMSSRRRGLVSIAMLIGLIILGLVAASLLKVSLARRTIAKQAEQQLQVDLLADSGIDRALARIDSNPSYSGEFWTIPAADLGGRGRAVLKIEVQADPDLPGDRRRVVVVADYLVGMPGLIRQTRTLRLPPSSPSR